MGDWWDLPSLNSHVDSGSLEAEGRRIKADIDCGNEAFRRLVAPMQAEIARLATGHCKRWNPRRVFLFGNHEHRITRAVNSDPKLAGFLSLDLLETPGFERHPFLEIVDVAGICFSHYFANTHSGKNIGGSIENRLSRIGRSFCAGHEQGMLYGLKQYPGKVVRHGLVCGSYYLHDEPYRGLQSNGEWRGVVVLNEVRNGGEYDVMPLSLSYLKRRFGDDEAV